MDPLSGNLLLAHTDLALPGDARFDLRVTRCYNSNVTEIRDPFNNRLTFTCLASPGSTGGVEQIQDRAVQRIADRDAGDTLAFNSGRGRACSALSLIGRVADEATRFADGHGHFLDTNMTGRAYTYATTAGFLTGTLTDEVLTAYTATERGNVASPTNTRSATTTVDYACGASRGPKRRRRPTRPWP